LGIPHPGFCPSDEQVHELLTLTRDHDPDVLRVAVKNLRPCHVRRDMSAVWIRLLELVGDRSPGVRMDELHNLTDGSPLALAEQVATALESLLHDPDDKVRGYARAWRARQMRLGRINVG
jgi:hypothetical protein